MCTGVAEGEAVSRKERDPETESCEINSLYFRSCRNKTKYKTNFNSIFHKVGLAMRFTVTLNEIHPVELMIAECK